MRSVMVLLLMALLITSCTGGGATHSTPSSQNSVALLPPGASVKPVPHTAGTSGTPNTHVSGHVAAVVNNGKVEVCSLITRSQIDQIMGVTLPAPRPVSVGTFDECATTKMPAAGSQAEPVHVAWAVPPVSDASLMFRQETINLPRSDAVSGVGSKAYCRTSGQSAAQLFVLVHNRFLEVFTDSCTHAVALANIALARL